MTNSLSVCKEVIAGENKLLSINSRMSLEGNFLSSNPTEVSNLTVISSNKTEVIIDDISSTIAFVGSVILSFLGTLANFLTIFVILKRKAVQQHSTSPLLFLSALTDFVFCLICLPFVAIRFYYREDFKWFVDLTGLCQYYPFVFYSNVSVSSYCLCLISLNRAIAVWNTRLSLKIFTWKKCIAYYILLWFFSLAYWLLPIFRVWGKIKYMPSTFSCTIEYDYWGGPINIFAIVGFSLPCLIAAISFIMIRIRISQSRQNVTDSIMESKVFGPIFAQERAVTRTAFIIIGSFVVLNLPVALIIIFDPMPPGKANVPGKYRDWELEKETNLNPTFNFLVIKKLNSNLSPFQVFRSIYF
jgi:hypothetical protein